MDRWSWRTNGTRLEGDEVLILSQHNIGLYDGDKKTEWKKGKVMLTTHHIIYQDDNDTSAVLQVALEIVRKAGKPPTTSGGFGAFSSPKIILPLSQSQYVKLSFRDGGITKFYDQLIAALEAKAWTRTVAVKGSSAEPSNNTGAAGPSRSAGATAATTTTQASAPSLSAAKTTQVVAPSSLLSSSPPPVPRGVGIAGVVQASAEAAVVPSTLQDIDDVMNKASSLVVGIRRLRERNEAAARSGSGNADDTAAEMVLIESIESTLGLGTVVTRSEGEKQFHKDLAMELHAWMTHERNARLFNEMPVVPLIELFALYNRARGGDLVSPADVLQACKHMTTQLPQNRYSLTTLSSGRKALVAKDDSLLLSKLEAVMGPQLLNPAGSKVQAALQKNQSSSGERPLKSIATSTELPRSGWAMKSISDVQLADQLHVAVPVAGDLLKEMEMKSYLCCADTGFDCHVYYWNVFVF